jgi:mRNA interferase RelE/StbE
LSAYTVRLAKHVGKQVEGLPERVQGRVVAALLAIRAKPTLGTKLRGQFEGSRRYRVGNYRIVYQVIEAEYLIAIENIRHRSRAYRR